MNRVYLTSGPRGSGKSTFAKKVIAASPEIILVSRDDILRKRFGYTSLDSYTGGHAVVYKIVFEKIKEHLNGSEDSVILLDHWNGFPQHRRTIIRDLRGLGVEFVFCLYFVLPLETCQKWFMKKDDSAGASLYSVESDYDLFYKTSSDIEADGFDGVVYIDPRQLLIPSVPIL